MFSVCGIPGVMAGNGVGGKFKLTVLILRHASIPHAYHI